MCCSRGFQNPSSAIEFKFIQVNLIISLFYHELENLCHCVPKYSDPISLYYYACQLGWFESSWNWNLSSALWLNFCGSTVCTSRGSSLAQVFFAHGFPYFCICDS